MDPTPTNVRLIPIILEGGLELGVHPKIAKLFGLKIDLERFRQIIQADFQTGQGG